MKSFKKNWLSHAHGIQTTLTKPELDRAILIADSILAEFTQEDLYMYAWDRLVGEIGVEQFGEWEDDRTRES
jgi:hypothetical protein